MDLSIAKNLVGYSDPIEMPVSELLTGSYHFVIPSYQRGYRWESSIDINDKEVRQVDDLLNDLTFFIDNNANQVANYYLQPLMVKPRYNDGQLFWDVLDGQQRLTTLLLILTCVNEKFKLGYSLYSIQYDNRPDIAFNRISFDKTKQDYNYPLPNSNLDSFYIRKAKDRIDKWSYDVFNTQQRKDKFKEALFYEDQSRVTNSTPNLRVKFIWYNAKPILGGNLSTPNRSEDIALFNRLNGGQISLTNSELLKALFMLCARKDNRCNINEEALVRKWDEMGRKFQDNDFWKMVCPKNKEYQNRLDFLFDFIRESDPNSKTTNSYRYYYQDMKEWLTIPNTQQLEAKWNDIKNHFDILCKWHENTTTHNYIGFLIENGKAAAKILKEIKNQQPRPALFTVKELVKDLVKTSDIYSLRYHNDGDKIKKLLLLFNVETCERHHEKFSFNQYRDRQYDIEHINSQTDNAIRIPQERLDWIEDQALESLNDDFSNMQITDLDYQKVQQLINEGKSLLSQGDNMKQVNFDAYRQRVEQYYLGTTTPSADKDAIGNLTLLNSSINREYKNALFPQKLRTIKRSDQEGEFIPLCTRYLFLKYYSKIKGSPSSFIMKRWTEDDQNDYCEAIINTLDKFLH